MKKIKVIGLVLVVTMLIGGMSTVAFATDKPADEATGDTYKEESFVDYAKSLGVLSESELAELEKVESKVEEIKTEIDAIYQKEELTEQDEAKLDKLFEEMDEQYAGIEDIMIKVCGNKEMSCDDFEDESYVDYVKSLGVLSEAELSKLTDTEGKAENIWNQIDAIYSKADITEADEAKANALMEEVDGLYAGIEDIMQKIFDAEQKQYFDYVKELGVLSEDEFATFVETEKKIEEFYAQMDGLWGDKEELSKEDEAKYESMCDEQDKLFEATQPLYDKIFGVEDEPCIVYDEEDAA